MSGSGLGIRGGGGIIFLGARCVTTDIVAHVAIPVNPGLRPETGAALDRIIPFP